MTMVLLGSLTGTLLGWLMGFLSLFLIMLILIQRGKGGGLTGALGGPGGQSAFGSKAGDTFTAITIVVASLWGFTCALTMFLLGTESIRPVVAAEPRVTAGPGDEEEANNSLIIPARGGLSGAVDQPAATGETPSMDLTPAVPADGAAEPATETSEPATETSQPATETATEASAPATEASQPAVEGEATESAAETPAADSSDGDK